MGSLGKRVTCWCGYLRNERGESINPQIKEDKDRLLLYSQISIKLKTTSKSWVEDNRFVASLYPFIFPINTQPY